MRRRQPRATRTYTLLPYTTLFRSHADQDRPKNLRGAPARRPDVAGTDAGAKSGDLAGHCKAGHPALSAQTTLAMRRTAEALKRFSYRFGDEVGLHRGIKLALESQQIDYLHEHVTGDDRFDFLCPGGIVIEAKIKGSMSDALRQVDRYLARDDVNGVVLATTTLWGRKPANRPQLRGKPLMFALIGRQSF